MAVFDGSVDDDYDDDSFRWQSLLMMMTFKRQSLLMNMIIIINDEEEETFKWQFLTTWLHLSHSGGVPSIENFRFLSIF